MKNSIQNTATSILLGLISLSYFAQEGTSRYVRKNEKAPMISYAEGNVYARGILVDEGLKSRDGSPINRVFTANSTGEIYVTELETSNSKKLVGLDILKELRDIEKAESYFIAMKSGDNGRLVRFNSAGETEIIKYPEWDSTFFDGMDFLGSRGFLMGDPIDGFFELYHSTDAGKTWERCPAKVPAHANEAGFAASGTNVQILNDSTYLFVSGGEKSRFFRSSDRGSTWTSVVLPYYHEVSSGAFSLCFLNDSIGVIVGGDYLQPDLRLNTGFYTSDGGKTWYNATAPLRGYRSCVFASNNVFYACGTNGIDLSFDQGKTWMAFANGNYFSLAATSTHLIATTKNGNIQLFELIKAKK